MSNTSLLATSTFFPTTSILLLRTSECAYFYYDNVALMVWATASVFCFFALISTIFTIYHSYQLWSTVQDLENSIIDLIDESCQILLPLGVCKQICHPHHIGNVNANYTGGQKGQKQEQKCRKDNRYPEDVTFPPSDIEKVYDVMGDEDARRSKTMTIQSIEESGDVKSEKKELKKVVSREFQLQKTPTMGQSRENLLASREPISDKKKPVQQVSSSAKMSVEAGKPSREAFPTAKSRENLTPKGSMKTPSREPLAQKKSAVQQNTLGLKMSMEAVTPRNMSKESSGGKALEKSPSLPPASTQNDMM